MNFKRKGRRDVKLSFKIAALALSASLALSACGSSKSPGTAAPEPSGENKETPAFTVPTDPVTLRFLVHGVNLTDTDFQNFYVEPLKKKYPYITLDIVRGNGTVGSLEKLIASNDMPDLMLLDNDWYMPLKQMGLPQDLTELIKKFQIDLNKLNPQIVQTVRNMDPGIFPIMPYYTSAGAMFYNKDLFKKFGVPYPTDDMKWPEVIELARRMTRMQDGVQYIGIDLRYPDHMVSQYSQPFVDSKTNKALIDIPVYRKVLDIFDQVYKMPGFVNGSKFDYGPNGFIKDKIVAMMPDWYSKTLSDLVQAQADGLAPDWDLVTNPTFDDNAGKGRHAIAGGLAIAKTSKYKDQAMQVIQMMSSREEQILLSSYAKVTILNDDEVKKAFGTAFPALKDKNTAAIFKYPAAATPPAHIADKEVQSVIRNMRKELAVNKKDINTVLREAQEQADKKIAELIQTN
jgi:multiple sugar transport system substrate-binding protein